MNGIDKKDIKDVMALSPAQEGLLFHYLNAPGEDFYIEQLSLALTGPINIDYFKQAWRFVVDSNEMLRCYFRWEMILSNHHILYDGWSNGVILKEFFSAYNEFARQRTLRKPVKTKYRKYISWLQGQDRETLKTARESYLNDLDAGNGLSIKRKKKKMPRERVIITLHFPVQRPRTWKLLPGPLK